MPDQLFNLQSIPLFSNMSAENLSVVQSLMKEKDFAPGQTIIRESDAGDSFYIIVQGHVKFTIYADSKKELLLGEAVAGEYFGELSMLTGAPRSARVVAVEATKTLSLEFKDFEAYLLLHPHAAVDVMRTLATRLHKSDEILRKASSKNVNELDDGRKTLGEKLSDGFASMMGSWNFIIWQSLILFVWVVWNSIAGVHNMMYPSDTWVLWDAYPFVFLNLVLSFQAAYAAPIIMMSQNRSANKDRLSAEIDHEVNVKAELQIGHVIKRLDDLEKSINYRLDDVRR